MRVTVEKDTVVGSFVLHVDTDCPSEACRFELMNSDVFRIDPMNGIIVTSSPLPDDVTSYHLPIRIHPPPPSTHPMEIDVFVTVIPSSDSAPSSLIRHSDPPVHLKRAYTFATWQNVSVGTVVGRLPRGRGYSTEDTVAELGVFPDGAVFVGKTIMRDTVTLEVELKTRNTTQSTIITLLIKPLNLHAPRCSAHSIHVAEDVRKGTVVGRLEASDEDSGINGIIEYSMDSDVFHVDPSTGELMVLKTLDAEKGRSLEIQYEVKDYGTPPKSTICRTTVTLEDVNDNPPVFSSRFYTARISGRPNETVAIVHASDSDVDPRNQRIQYRLLTHGHLFHVDPKTGRIQTTRRIRNSLGRMNVSVEAVNGEAELILSSSTFLLITVDSDDVAIHLNSDDVIRIFRNDRIGDPIFRIDVTSSESVIWRTEDPRFHVDSKGDVILIQKTTSSEPTVILFSSESGSQIQKIKFQVLLLPDEDREEEKIIHLETTNSTWIQDLSSEEEWRIRRVIHEDSDDVNGFWIRDGVLYSEENSTTGGGAYVILETKEEESSSFKIFHITHPNSTSTSSPESSCSSSSYPTAHLILPPATVSLECPDSLQNSSTSNLQIHNGSLLIIPNQEEIIRHVDLQKGSLTLILDVPSEDVIFSTSSILMLLSSVHPIGESFGRVTAESSYRIRYFLIGTDRISIDPDTGELVLRKRFFDNLNDILILAVIPNGIAKAKITIEVIEDRLVLRQSNFLILPPPPPYSSDSSSPIGSISIDRDDVIIDVIDDHFYVRNREIYVKNPKEFHPPSNHFYEMKGEVKKGKLSTRINVTLAFIGGRRRRGNDMELMMEVEENAPEGTVVGQVPDPSSKYRLIDPSCGLLIDSEGIIRTTRPFDREIISLIKTKMIEGGKIWSLFVFIGDVNDNPPRILNSPGRILLGAESEEFHYKLHWTDLDSISDPYFEIVGGDFFGHLNVSEDTGDISLKTWPSESFNATIRIHDQRPPFHRNSDDVTIEFIVEKKRILECMDSEFFLSSSSMDPRMKMEATSSEVTWRIVPNGIPQFQIHPMTGEIQRIQKTSSRLQNPEDLRIQVISFDATSSGFCRCRIHNLLEDHPTPILNSTYEFWISESSDRHQEVGRIPTSSGSIFRIHDDFNFTISPFDGVIFTNSPLDYEDVKFYEFNVSSSLSTVSLIRIHVIDENDEAPRFVTGDVVHLEVREEAEIQYPAVIGSSIAEDLDEGQNGLVTYSILSGNTSLFAVNSTTGEILSLGPLDREESALYELQIEAKDAGIPSLSATSRILIHVEDINDNTPEFDISSYFIKIPENLPSGSRILKVHASDRDEGSRLLYFLDEEKKFHSKWKRQVVGLRVLVEIHVDDVNDNHPKIENPNLDVYIPEDVSVGTVIHVIDIQDSDLEDHLKFFINDTSFLISESGEILTTSESTFPSSIKITVTDDVGHVASSEYRFYLHPKKQFPVFIERIGEVSVREHEAQELAVFKAKGKGVRYSVIGRCKKDLELDSVSGILKAKSTLDRERYPECHVFIMATSFFENKPLAAITKLLIKIVDINDNSPRFDHQLYHFNVTENSGATLIGNVVARDPDAGSRVFYEIIDGDPAHEFQITENGQIETIRDLDRESRSEYRLILEAFDDGKPRRRGRSTVVVKVLDEDDNAPRFSRIFHVEVPEDVGIGEEIIVLSASDSDEQSDHRFEFENSGGEERIPFSIEEETGRVTVNDTLDFEKKSTYRIKVRLTDGAWLIETSLFVNVKDVNDNSPVFQQPVYFFTTVGDYCSFFPKKFFLGKLNDRTCSGVGLGFGGQRKDTDSMTSPYFRIHPDSGVLTRLRPLPEVVMVVEVTAMDHGIPRRQATVVCHVAQGAELRRIRKGAGEGEIVGRIVSGVLYPPGIATVTREGDLILKKTVKEGFWILEQQKMIFYEVVENSESQNIQNSDVLLNISSSLPSGTVIHHLRIPGCVEFLGSSPSAFRILPNGTVLVSGIPDESTVIRVTCNDGIWPIRESAVINVRIQMTSNPEDVPLIKRKPRISQKSLPKSLEIRVSPESPPGTLVWMNDVPIAMENNEYLNSTKNLILKKAPTSSESQFEIFSGNHYHRSTITLLSDPDSPVCPVFPKKFYFFEKSQNSQLHDFGFDLKDCKMEVEGENPIFYANGSALISLKPLPPGTTYQFPLVLRSRDSVRSRCHVAITVPLRATVTHQDLPTVIFVPKNYSNPIWKLPEDYKLQKGSEFRDMDSGVSGRDLTVGIHDLRVQKGHQDPKKIRIFVEDLKREDPMNSSWIQIQNSEDVLLLSGAITLDVFSSESSLPHLIQSLRSTYPDMKIYPLATWQILEDVRYQMTISIVDRNGVIVDPLESRKTLMSFFKKHPPPYMEFLGFLKDPCDDVICIQKNSRCRRILFESRLSGECHCKKDCEETPELESCGSCGSSGTCFNGTCRCTEGFESLGSCDKANDVFSSREGHLEIRKTQEDLPGCDTQKMEFDFKTTHQAKSQLLKVEFGKQVALVELISGSLSFSISDEFTRPIETRIEKRVNDGHWHRLLLQMSDDGRRISIQVDGRGKEVKSRVPLPMLFDSRRILLMTSSEFCFRRLLIQNQLLSAGMKSKFFNVTGTVINTCRGTVSSEPGSIISSFSNTTTVILLSILAVISLIALAVCILSIKRRQKTTDCGWKKATEIDAFAVPRIRGHVNRSMVKSPDDENYDVYGMVRETIKTINYK
uniref:LAM_G_DOMAIN domain-containing protein n=1 Tax=Caenorhabditis tropicalis TaxID=1561998 RepID=A0A1I7ULN9_9PELO